MSQAIFDKFVADTRAKLIEAVNKYNLSFDPLRVKIRLDIRGQVAGYASLRNGIYQLRFNPEAILNYNEDMTNDTIPHEVAHLVCYNRRELGKDHDAGWKRVCRELGGDDSRTHDMTLTKAKIKTIWRYEYNVNGEVVMVGPKHHKHIQSPLNALRPIVMKRGGARILKEHFVRALADGKPVTTIIRSGQPAGVPSVQPIAASAPRPQTPNALKSKRQLAEEIFAANPNASRAQMIELFIAGAGMTKNGAATYYYNIKNGK